MYTITRQIGIDAGHRIPHHGSKCRNLHGHRYTIQATCEAQDVIVKGEQEGMVLDFGFLKDEMMTHIDAICDHAMLLWHNDVILKYIAATPTDVIAAQAVIEKRGWATLVNCLTGKTILLRKVPTAENLAEHWFKQLEPRVLMRSAEHARLVSVEVWETPNCVATYTPPDFMGSSHEEGR